MYSILDDFDRYKRQTDSLGELLLQDVFFAERAKKLLSCGTFLTFDGEKLVGANFCRQRLCPQCQRRRSLRLYGQISQMVDFIGNYKWLHVVLSRPNCSSDNLSGEITALCKLSSKLFTSKRVKQAFKGVLRCIEVSYNPERDDYHPHLHCLVAVLPSYFTSRYYLRRDQLAQMWNKLGGGSVGCFVKRVNDTASAVAEVAKYCVKPFETGDLSQSQYLSAVTHIWSALHGRRLLQSFGVVREALHSLKIDLDSDVDTDILDVNHLENLRSFSWDSHHQKFKEVIYGKD